ncbi:unnamed protein product [Closterium sp. NIES-53]
MLQQGTWATVRGGRSRGPMARGDGAMARGDGAMARDGVGRWAGTGPGAGQVRDRALGRYGARRWAGTGPGAGPKEDGRTGWFQIWLAVLPLRVTAGGSPVGLILEEWR